MSMVANENCTRIMICSRCGEECVRTNNRQKNCRACSTIVENERRRNGSPPIGGSIICKRCESPCQKTGHSQKYCSQCVLALREERYLKKYRAKQTQLATRIVGSKFNCEECGTVLTYAGGHHKYCGPCRADVVRQRDRDSRIENRRTVVCPVCSIEFVAKALNHTFCSSACYKTADTEKRNVRSAKHREKRKSDPAYIVSARMGAAIRSAIKSGKRGRKWESLVGYTLDDLIHHLERQFSEGMTWKNIGDWHIDHRIPKSSFSYSTPECEGFRSAWALSNLQPLWALDNLKKHAKIEFLV